MECPYCNQPLTDKSTEICLNCGFLISSKFNESQSIGLVSKQIFWILGSGVSSVIVLIFIISRIDLPFRFEFYLGLDCSFIMAYRVYFLFIRSDFYHVTEFFPRIREFFLITGILFWILFNGLFIIFRQIIPNLTVNISTIYLDTLNFFVGYALGLLTIYYFYSRSARYRKVKLLEKKDI